MGDGDRSGRMERRVRALEALAAAAQDQVAEQQKPKNWWERNGTPATVIVSAVAVCVTVGVAAWQNIRSTDQFEQTLRQNQYANIVDGLASSSVGVQVNSMRRMRQYVADPGNYEDDPAQQAADAKNAAQTLAAFIEDESTIPNHEGLSDYRDPQPVVVSRAMRQLIDLTAPPAGEDGTAFPHVAIDLSRGNFHGVAAAKFKPEGAFLAVAADFREATVTDWNLSAVPEPDLSNAFFTCANMQKSDLGTANVSGTDFTGANLRSADLTGVQNLTQKQLRGALVGPDTELPSDVEPPGRGWGIDKYGETFGASPRCRHLMDRMTNLLAGAGYSSRLPCPSRKPPRWAIRLSPPEQKALKRTCDLRTPLGRPKGQQPER